MPGTLWFIKLIKFFRGGSAKAVGNKNRSETELDEVKMINSMKTQ
jgi:hypothetical protein